MALGVLKRRPRASLVESAHLPAPIGGINTVDAASAMPEQDCVYLYNLLPAEYGLRSRLGYQEWATGLDGEVRDVIPFSGSHKNGSTDALFAATSSGLWTCTASTGSPSQPIAFGVTTGDAGRGISCVCATPAGRFLLHCDEENGLYVYTEGTATWTKVSVGTTVPWAGSTPYLVGDKVVNGSNVYVVTTAGTSASSGGPTGTGTGIADNTVVWNYVSAKGTNVIGPSLADQRAGFTANPANFAYVTVWKSRVWLVEKDTSRAWYLDTNAIYGTATSFDFGSRMQHGGPLAGLFNWSYDGGSGMDTLLVGVSTAGDVVIYQGTDPTSASTFGLKGTWFVGGVPYGRRLAIDYGGDVLVLSTLGAIPLSKLVIGNSILDRSQYATAKVANLFNLLASTYKTLPGWAVHAHPTDNALLILVPQAPSQPTVQLAMSFATRGWAQYRDLPMSAAAVWDGQLYFGTTDGRVCLNTGYVDNVSRTDSNDYTPVSWSVLTAYQNLGNGRNKLVQLVRPTLLSESPSPVMQATVRYGFDLSEPDPPSGVNTSASAGTWDVGLWDEALWAGEYTPSQPVTGGFGIGRDVAIAVRGTATSRTVLVGIDVHFEQGGVL